MAAPSNQTAAIADALASELKDRPFTVLRNEDYVVLIGEKLGVATIAGDKDGAAHRGALEVARQAGLLGLDVTVHPFVVDGRTDGDGATLRLSTVAADAVAGLERRAAESGATLSNDDAVKLVDFLSGRALGFSKADAPDGMSPVTPELRRMMAACAETALGEGKAWVAGIRIDADHLVAADFMLGPLLLVASENWTPPFIAAKRQGGFSFTIKRDPAAVVGYRVTGISMSSPLIVMLGLAAVIRSRAGKGGAVLLDDCVLRFAEFVRDIKGSADIFGDVDVAIIGTRD